MATCKDCIFVDMCDYTSGTSEPACGHFKDSSRVVELPDKHGNLVDVNEVKEKLLKYGFSAPDMTVTEFIEDELTTVVEAE